MVPGFRAIRSKELLEKNRVSIATSSAWQYGTVPLFYRLHHDRLRPEVGIEPSTRYLYLISQ